MRRFQIVREVESSRFQEAFLVSAVIAFLVIRAYLALTGFPRVGGGNLHIAHMLWGGLLMLVALVLVLTFLGKRVKLTAAILGGLGFGTFIDELGKFITSDNDYFYQPTVAIIYIVFMLLLLGFRQLQRRQELTPDEALINAAEMMTEVLLDRASEEEVARALYLLQRSGAEDDVGRGLRMAVLGAARAPDREPAWAVRAVHAIRATYQRLIRWPRFHRAIILIFLARSAFYLGSYGLLATAAASPDGAETRRSFAGAAVFAATTGSSLMALIGVALLRRYRISALIWFKRSVLASIYFSQVFVFVLLQLSALAGLAVDVLTLAGLNFMLDEERAARQGRVVGQPEILPPGPATGR